MTEHLESAVYVYPGTEHPLVVYRPSKEVPISTHQPQEETDFLADLYEEVRSVLWLMKKAPVIEKSRLDRGFYVFAIMRYSEWTCQSEAIYIGTADGSARQEKSVFDLQRKYSGSGVVILARGLSKSQSHNARRALVNRLHPCENRKR